MSIRSMVPQRRSISAFMDPDRPNLTFHTAPWTTFLTHLKRGRGAVDRG